VTSYAGPISLANPLWVGAVNTLSGATATAMEENGMFHGLVTMTAGIVL